MCWEAIDQFRCSKEHTARQAHCQNNLRAITDPRDEPHVVIKKCHRARTNPDGIPCSLENGRQWAGHVQQFCCCSERCCDAARSPLDDEPDIINDRIISFKNSDGMDIESRGDYNNLEEMDKDWIRASEPYVAEILDHGMCPVRQEARREARGDEWIPISDDPFASRDASGEPQPLDWLQVHNNNRRVNAWAGRADHPVGSSGTEFDLPSRPHSVTSIRPHSRNRSEVRSSAGNDMSDSRRGSTCSSSNNSMSLTSQRDARVSNRHNIAPPNRRDSNTSNGPRIVTTGARYSNLR